ncbi:efflux transporter outer membrane subunit [Herbaspirillum sp. RV1423]|uniref:efflux transporter outer membrane subunit n=1 Tax=Herbaspirillum sp. RV1423 TaxID=1443993 RepID=UPI001E5083DD|nr:efflux transporter outer membrane subunit [Herbaspirillum sp. RV1423]
MCMSAITKSWRYAAGAAVAHLLCACTVGVDYVRQPPPIEAGYTMQDPSTTVADAGGNVQRFHMDAAISAEWWKMFHSEGLAEAVNRAFLNNASLQAAQASLKESQHSLQAGYGVFFPQIDGSFSATRQLPSAFRYGAASPAGIFNLFTLGAAISYTLDIFGGQRRAVEALGAQADYQKYVALATYLTLSGNVVNTAIARAAYNAQYEATQELIRRQEEQVAIAEKQADRGIASYATVLSLRSLLASSRAALATVAQKRDQADHLLANLQGTTASGTYTSSFDLAELELPQNLPLSLPSELVRQRPDILSAEAQLHVASAEIGVATAALFPSFGIGANYAFGNTRFGNLTDSSSKFWSIGPSMDIPIFHGGATWYKRSAAEDAYQQALASYRQTVLSAFEQVANVLTAIEHDAQSMKAQAEALGAAEQTLKLIEANYRAGLVSYLDVLAADSQYYQSKIAYLQVSAQRYQDTTALFVALGGGWWNAPPPFVEQPASVQVGGK